jgi:glycerol-3-phosphate dehydrogenase
MQSSASQQRANTVARLKESRLDLLIIGGGIVGSGIARDAAMRGLRVGLVEQHDFASGTSGRSSRLLHGGIRYLAQGRLRLVHQASVEKKIIHRIAPHLSDPLAFIFPAYRGDKYWSLWQLKIGVKIYDLLCGGRNLGKSTWLNRDELLRTVPGLNPEDLNGGVRYFDGFTNDARLTLDTLRSAAHHGAILLNYCRFGNATRKDVWQCELADAFGDTQFSVQTQAVINATGPWAQGVPHSRVKLRLTKGIHVVVDRSRIPVPDTLVMTEGKRIMFAIPWGERTIIGTTDVDYDGPLDSVHADPSEIRQLLDKANQFFPSANLTEHDVISTWAGLRPLLADKHGNPSDISRAHEIRNPEPGWWDVAGGKLTTYRLMAEQTVDQVIAWAFRTSNKRVAPCRTAVEPLIPPSETDGISGIPPPKFERRAVEHYCANEWTVHLEDVMVRRTGWHYYFADASKRAEEVADWMAEIMGWSKAIRANEIGRYRVATGSSLHW